MKILLPCLLLAALTANAQKRDEVYQVKSATDVNKAIPFEGRFQYAAFNDGKVHFRDGRTSKAKLNYSLVHGEVMFIAPTHDTLLLGNVQFIDRVYIGPDIFYYQPSHGHIRIAADYGNIKLGKKEFLVRMGHEKYASYGQYSSTSAISSYATFMNERGEYSFLQANERILLKRREVFFLVDKNDRLHIANRTNLMRIFPSSKSKISRFLRENEINLEKEPDLDKTLTFCSTL